MSRAQSDLQSRRHRERGFTLLELMVVVAILGLLVAIVAPNVLKNKAAANIKIAKQSIAETGEILEMYKLDVGNFPSSEQGLDALINKPADATNWAGPYLKGKKLPLDPWGKPFVYRMPSSRSDHDFDVCSTGAKGETGGAEDTTFCNE